MCVLPCFCSLCCLFVWLSVCVLHHCIVCIYINLAFVRMPGVCIYVHALKNWIKKSLKNKLKPHLLKKIHFSYKFFTCTCSLLLTHLYCYRREKWGWGGGDDHTSSYGFNHHLHQIKTKFHFIYRNFIEKIQLLRLCHLLFRASYRSSFHQHSRGKNK